ncbi:MAG: ATP-binding protein [Candidatus Dormibacteria bacterium]
MNTRSPYPAHRVTTAHLQAAFPCIAGGSLGSRGPYIGRDLYGGAFCYDPWELYSARILTGPNAIVAGQIGRGKSSFIKTYVWRQLVFGRKAWMLDPKGENGRLCQAAGVEPIRIRPGGTVRLNPLDPHVGGANRPPDQVQQEQLSVLQAIIGASLRRGLTPEERVACELGLVQATASTNGEPTLKHVVAAMLSPSPDAARSVATTAENLARGSREAALELRRLCEGDLKGMFDDRTSGSFDLDAPIVSLDMSAVYQSDALGILMVCAAAWLQRALTADTKTKRIFVADEVWAILGNLAIARWLQASWKLSRALGVQNIAVIHRLSDLTAAGAADSEQVQLAKGLLSDSETRIVYGQSPGEIAAARELLGLTETEAEVTTKLLRGVALWKVGQRSFLVEHRLSPTERWIVDTDDRMVTVA